MTKPNFHLTIPVSQYTRVLLIVTLVLVSVHLGLYYYNYEVEELPWLLLQLFDLDEENNLPTWFSGFLLLNCATFLFIYSKSALLQKKQYWGFMAAGFLLLAIDEVAGLHETFNSSTEINWALPGAILVLLVALALVPFLLSLRRGLALRMIFSGFIYISGAIIVELLSEDMDSESLNYMLAVALEEGLEMMGALLFLNTVLKEMSQAGKVPVDLTIS